VIFEELGAREDDDARWLPYAMDLGAYAGQSIQLQVECADGARP
jgi:hypothetical protein